ncbi:AraC family transcriptional regulator [Paenibacillus sp. CAU 1782]
MQDNELMRLWQHAAVQLLDVSRGYVKPGSSVDSKRSVGSESGGSYVDGAGRQQLEADRFIILSRGSALLHADNVTFFAAHPYVMHAPKGTVLLVLAADDHKAVEYYQIDYSLALPPDWSSPTRQPLYSIRPESAALVLQQTEELYKGWNRPGAAPDDHFRLKVQFYVLVETILRQRVQSGKAFRSGLQGGDRQKTLSAKVTAHIRKHYGEHLTLDALAERFNYSPAYLSVQFKRQTGHSPIDYLIQVRIAEAERLLLESDCTLQDIARSVGYEDPHYFGRLFKKHKGMPPMRYRSLGASGLLPETTEAGETWQPPPKDSPLFDKGLSIESQNDQWYIADSEYETHYQQRKEDSSMLKRSLAASLLLSMTIMLAACGGGAGGQSAASATPAGSGDSIPSPSSGAASSSEPAAQQRTKTDALGNEVVLPDQPQRIIASYLEDHLVALGIKPVAQWSVYDGKTVQFYLQDELAEIPVIPGELPYEVVAGFEPDLILIDNAEMASGGKYEQYAKIAPTYTVGDQANNDWRQELLIVGEVLNKSEEAKAALEAYERKASEAKEQIQETFGSPSAAVLWVTAKSVYVVNPKLSSGAVIYEDLGFNVPATVQKATEGSDKNWTSISLEALAGLEADHLFIVNTSEHSRDDLLSNPLWSGIPAVANGNLYDFDNQHSWLYTGTIANSKMIDDVLEVMLGNQ